VKQIIFIFSLALLFSCNKKAVEVIWINEKTEVESQEVFVLVSDSVNKVKQCLLYTTAQPIILNFKSNGDTLLVQLPNDAHFINGNAHLALVFEDDLFVSAPFIFKHGSELTSELKDYRSPKTVITDSSLNQQSIIYTIDEHRNLLSQEGDKYVVEEWNTLSPKAATYRADKDAPESSYYVLAGSVATIQLQLVSQEVNKPIVFKTNILKDKYGNVVDDGTKAVFTIKTDGATSRIETAVLDGMLYLNLPVIYTTSFDITAAINNTNSNTLNITPR
jgi:hypothetical protein